jgi:hypothetical protein
MMARRRAIDVLTAVPGRGWVLSRCRWRNRVTALLKADRLDEQLAGGTAPETSDILAIRAEFLTRMTTRKALANQLRRLVWTASGASIQPALRPISWRSVRAVAPDLTALGTELTNAGPVAAAGVAQVSILLSDAWGPGARGNGVLRDGIARARQSL